MNIEDYWSTDETICTPFIPKYMSKDRFLLLLSHLHFTDNEAAVPRGEMGYDPLYKLRPVISHFQMAFSDIYSPERYVSFDEGTCAFKGRVKFGIKLYQLCEASTGPTGYRISFHIYSVVLHFVYRSASDCIILSKITSSRMKTEDYEELELEVSIN